MCGKHPMRPFPLRVVDLLHALVRTSWQLSQPPLTVRPGSRQVVELVPRAAWCLDEEVIVLGLLQGPMSRPEAGADVLCQARGPRQFPAVSLLSGEQLGSSWLRVPACSSMAWEGWEQVTAPVLCCLAPVGRPLLHYWWRARVDTGLLAVSTRPLPAAPSPVGDGLFPPGWEWSHPNPQHQYLFLP